MEFGPLHSPVSCIVPVNFQFFHLLVLYTAYITGSERFIDVSRGGSVAVQEIYSVRKEKNYRM